MKGETWTSAIQGCARHNTFIALAVAERVFGTDTLAEPLANADFVLVAVPLLPSTQGLMNGKALAHIKPGAVLIDVSRGGAEEAEDGTHRCADEVAGQHPPTRPAVSYDPSIDEQRRGDREAPRGPRVTRDRNQRRLLRRAQRHPQRGHG